MPSATEVKKTALDFERENYHYLQFVDSTDGFKQLFDHSALIFKTDIAERIGYKTVNFRADGSTTKIVARYGLISFKNFENLRTKLLRVGLEEDKSLSKEGLTFFKLLKRYSKADINKMVNALASEKQRLRRIISPQNPSPLLFVYLEELQKSLYENLRQTHSFAQRTIGAEIQNLSSKSLELYLFYANEKLSNPNDYLDELLLIIKKIWYNLKTVENLGLIHTKNLERILENAVRAERALKKEKELRDAK